VVRNFFLVISLLFITSLSMITVSCKKSVMPLDPKVLSKVVAGTSEFLEKGANKKMHNSFHKKHDKAEVSCIKCHHKFYNDDRVKICADCHEGTEENVLAPCIACHTEKNK
jgi:ribosomal protein L37E